MATEYQQPTDEGMRAMKQEVEKLQEGKGQLKAKTEGEEGVQDQPRMERGQAQRCQVCERMREIERKESPVSAQGMKAEAEDMPTKETPKQETETPMTGQREGTEGQEQRCADCNAVLGQAKSHKDEEYGALEGTKHKEELQQDIQKLQEQGKRLEEEGRNLQQRARELQERAYPGKESQMEKSKEQDMICPVGMTETRNVEEQPKQAQETGSAEKVQSQGQMQGHTPRIICIPCDLGEHSMKTVEWANSKVATSDDHIILVSVREHQKQTVDQKISKDVIDVSEVHQQKEDEKVEEVLKQFKGLMPNRDVELKVLRGDKRHELVKYINDLEPNFVLVGAREMSKGIKKAFTNSTSEYLAQHLHAPVMIYRPFAKTK